jgi:type IV pilus assembly protein PilE
MKNLTSNQKGFNLIELMVVVAIIGTIASFAVPSYQRSVVKSARGVGTTELLDIMRSQENYFANNFSYTSNLTHLNLAAVHITDGGRYKITAAVCSVDLALTQCVKLTATALAAQIVDGNLSLDSEGNRLRNNNIGWD